MSNTDHSETLDVARAMEKLFQQIKEGNKKDISRMIPFMKKNPEKAVLLARHTIGEIDDEEYSQEMEKLELDGASNNTSSSSNKSVSLKVKGVGSHGRSNKRQHVGDDGLFNFVNSETGRPHIPHVRERVVSNETVNFLPSITAESTYYDYERIISKFPNRKDRLYTICQKYLSQEQLESQKISVRSNCEDYKRCLKDYVKAKIDTLAARTETSVVEL